VLPLSPETIRTVVEKTLRETPPDAGHWSTRTLARAVGLGKTSIQKIWREHGLKPHRVRSFKVSRDPAFVDKSLPSRRRYGMHTVRWDFIFMRSKP
jgi:hypothetical protein